MLVVLSLNTALDRVWVVPGLQIGEVHRTEQTTVYAGGKGLNVARVLRSLGQPVRVIGFLGGAPASRIEERCEHLGVETHWVRITGESRTCLILVDPENGRQTVVNEPGPRVTPEEVMQLRTVLDDTLRTDDVLAISGSAPPGAPNTLYREVVECGHERGVQVLVDASGDALCHALDAGPWAVAPNLDEARAIAGSVDSPRDVAVWLASRADIALLTLGAEGVLCAGDEELWQLRPPTVPVVNAVGSGDAFVAGFLAGTVQGCSSLDAVRLGVACGASNAARLEPGIGSPEEIEHLADRVTVLSCAEC